MSSESAPSIGKTLLLASLWTEVGIALCFVVIRLYGKLRLFRRLFVDDLFVVFAWVVLVANAVLVQWVAPSLYLIYEVAAGTATSVPDDFLDEVSRALHIAFATYVLYYAGLYINKVSFLFFFRTLNNNIKRQRILWWCVFAFTVSSLLISIGILDHRCFFGPVLDVESICHGDFPLQFSTALDVISDALIIWIPTNILWSVKIDIRKKLALVGICWLILFIIAFSITRISKLQNGQLPDQTWLFFWSGLELATGKILLPPAIIISPLTRFCCKAIIVACLTSFRALYTKSERSRHGRTPVKHSGSYGSHMPSTSDTATLQVEEKNQNSTFVSSQQRQNSDDSSAEFEMLPGGNVYVQHEFSVVGESTEPNAR
ncbi:MAG: hypothetical protein MMC33_007600 [Icmadophila ericetorum]|nr:hypothetical protein [Icmadophila ericetorum]